MFVDVCNNDVYVQEPKLPDKVNKSNNLLKGVKLNEERSTQSSSISSRLSDTGRQVVLQYWLLNDFHECIFIGSKWLKIRNYTILAIYYDQ